ncbi:TPA: hypothetical protein RHK74_002799 [Enterococcus faecalis]|uniref:hypothetical protein n=1 Tax=Enterococcus faecalis TaxID=1351 RepID=UPI000330237B|nr:hypothetical protein [Enterococcus faecalis]EKZ0493766.1 hypothetical protein [Enterococcus faecalis]EOF44777.1 hypothetical protein SC9_00447 [Enterococcus faecalis EnGen0101]MBD9835816.1 hypothetical protein [Enterococcus faecalis]PQG27421.1 hypothetical protein CUS39_05260 [Enterococcus faecalis]HAP2865322.1 hypothetical protein [Enterococcus faecalis]
MSMVFSLFFVSLLVCVSLPAEGDTIGSHIAYLICSGFSVLVCVSSFIVDKELLYLLPIVASAFCIYVEVPYVVDFFSKWTWRRKDDV